MASNQTFTKEPAIKLDVVTKFNELMKASVDKDSIYIKMKETLDAMFQGGTLTEREKTEAIAQTLGSFTTSVTNSAMQLAYQITKDEAEFPYDLAKLVADVKLTQEQADKLSEENELIEEQKNKMVLDGWKLQADVFSKNGIDITTNSLENPLLTSVIQTNKFGTDYVSSEVAKADKFAKLNNTFRRDGIYIPTYDANKDVTGASEAVIAWTPLVKAQTDVSIRQEQAFDDNMRQHAANSSANMIGLLLSTENFSALTTADVDAWRSAVNYLNTPLAP